MKKAIISALILSVLILGGSSAAIAVKSNAKDNDGPVFVAAETEFSKNTKTSTLVQVRPAPRRY